VTELDHQTEYTIQSQFTHPGYCYIATHTTLVAEYISTVKPAGVGIPATNPWWRLRKGMQEIVQLVSLGKANIGSLADGNQLLLRVLRFICVGIETFPLAIIWIV